jgi:DNA-binding transcriptional regulator YdaS (Cro superfamily)
MLLNEKLVKFFEDTGIRKKWFADKIGIESTNFYQCLAGRYAPPPTYWKSIVITTKGKITVSDLFTAYMRCDDILEFLETSKPGEAKVRLRDFEIPKE